MDAPTSEELTHALMLAIKGDSKMTPEDVAYVHDVIRRDANAEAERMLAFYEGVIRGS